MLDQDNMQSQAFDQNRFLRKLERDRKLRELDKSFQVIAEQAKQKQDDIFTRVFTKKGQEETFASYPRSELSTQRVASFQMKKHFLRSVVPNFFRVIRQPSVRSTA